MNGYYQTFNIKCKTKILEIRSDPNGKLVKYFREKNENSIGDITGFTDRVYLTFLSIVDGIVCTNPDKLTIAAICIICECDRLGVFRDLNSTFYFVMPNLFSNTTDPCSIGKVYNSLLDHKPMINKILGINHTIDRQTSMNLGKNQIRSHLFNKKGHAKIIPFLMRCDKSQFTRNCSNFSQNFQFNKDCMHIVANFFTKAYITDYYNFLWFKIH